MTSSCPSGKVRYRDQIGAKFALAVINRRGGKKRREQRAYRCPTCNGWHLTSRGTARPA